MGEGGELSLALSALRLLGVSSRRWWGRAWQTLAVGQCVVLQVLMVMHYLEGTRTMVPTIITGYLTHKTLQTVLLHVLLCSRWGKVEGLLTQLAREYSIITTARSKLNTIN